MGWVQDLFKEIQLSPVLKERVALAEDKYEGALKEIDNLKQRVAALEKENADLRAQIPDEQEAVLDEAVLDEDTTRVLVYFFKANNREERDVGTAARALGMERGVLQYHLDRLKEAGMANMTGANVLKGHTYWTLSPEGRRYAVEHKLI